MSNHYHLVLHVNRKAATALTDTEVIERWQRLFSLPVIVSRYRQFLDERLSVSARVGTISRRRNRTNVFCCKCNAYNRWNFYLRTKAVKGGRAIFAASMLISRGT